MKTINFIIIIIVIIFIIPVAQALDSTQSATPSASVKSKLEALKLEIASKAAKLKQEINQKISNKAYIGTISSISITSITLTTKTATVSAQINQDTVYSPQKSLKVGDFIAALGEVDETGVLHAKKIVILPQPKIGQLMAETFSWGQIISVTDDLATLKGRSGKITTISLIKISTEVKTNNFVIVKGNLNKNGILETKFLHIIPQGFVLKPKNATSSAKRS
mgnify:CR=1 FL=1